MFKKILTIMAGVSMIVTANTVIAEPTNTQVDKNKIQLIQTIIEARDTKPSKNKIAQEQIEKRRQELIIEADSARKIAEEAEKARLANIAKSVKKVLYANTFNVEQWRPLVAKYPWPVEQALLTMKLESGGNPNSVSRTDDHGLYQIHNGLSVYGSKIYDPEFNVRLAYENYYKTRGWRPWYAVRGILW